MPEVNPHLYRATYVPSGCTSYVQNETYELVVQEPAQEEFTLGGTTACAGTQFVLEDE